MLGIGCIKKKKKKKWVVTKMKFSAPRTPTR